MLFYRKYYSSYRKHFIVSSLFYDMASVCFICNSSWRNKKLCIFVLSLFRLWTLLSLLFSLLLCQFYCNALPLTCLLLLFSYALSVSKMSSFLLHQSKQLLRVLPKLNHFCCHCGYTFSMQIHQTEADALFWVFFFFFI